MTAMDSDSESQDSDDGRRFRFEATRKDSAATVNTTDRTKTPKRYKSSHGENYRDRKERSKHESKTDDKDFRHFTKHSKHDLRNLKQEDNKNSYKDHRENRSGFATNDRGSRNSNGGDARERSRDSKRQLDRDRSVHRMQRSREHSYERNHHDERASSDKHRGRYHERHKHRSRDRSRDRSHQSSRVKSSNDDHRSREDHGRHDSSRKLSKENRSHSRDCSSPKNTERERSHSETRSSENTKKDSSIEAQDCKDLDLSQFDVLSETDENMSDSRDSESRTSSPHSRKIKLKRHDSEIQSESCAKRKNDDEASTRKLREELKVKRRSYDPASSSSNNNPSAVSDSLLNSASHTTLLVTREACMDSEREKSEYREEERMLIYDSNVECSNSRERYLCSNASSDEHDYEKDMDQAGPTYGPLLPPEFASNASDDNKLDSEINILEDKIDDEVDGKNMNFIGPRLLPQLNDHQSIEREDAVDAVFGPALPPHLLQRQQKKDSLDRIIGPMLPDVLKSREEGLIASPNSDDDSAIGPLPVDHPALRTSRVHEQLDLRAQRIRNEKYSEEMDIGNKREEWMTELPPAQAANLGLGPRKFRLRDGPDMSDRSCWTDTPAQKAQKQMDLEAKRFKESEKKHVNEYHKEVDKSRKHERSLLEMHQSKIAKKKKKEEKEARRTGISTRRPFDRDIDLQVNRFDQAQKKTILMKAQLLDDRFSRGQV
ncbi:PREDICTED: zinc finger CCCH domain-containing protein 13 [Trachymyrmex cornetzi]|nr:PREDICTED: zinc finger CCCH domain-containing protein 13 [Trachymyrmex cornetzi]